jgi:hypothetical protein
MKKKLQNRLEKSGTRIDALDGDAREIFELLKLIVDINYRNNYQAGSVQESEQTVNHQVEPERIFAGIS